MFKVAIIIVNWNGLRFLKDCLTSVYKQTYTNFDVYFVDNGSVDDSVSYVKENFPQTKIIPLEKNTGFAGGNNVAIAEALKDTEVAYIVCLNNDTIVEPDWLKSLVETVDQGKKVDMVSSAAFFTDGNIQTIGLRFEKDLMGDKIGGLSIGYGENPNTYTQIEEVLCPSGVSALYTRRLLEDVGFFDEDFFAYSEDLDLGLRARNKGYVCGHAANSKLIHLHSQSSGGAASPLKAYLIKRNNYFVAIKNFSFLELALFPFRDLFWNLKQLKEKKGASATKLKEKIGLWGMIKIMVRVYFSVLISAPKFLIKRWNQK